MLPPVTDDSNEDNKLSTILVHGDAKKTLDIPHHDEVEIVLVSDGGEIKSSESSDVEVWNDGCPLPSSGPTCSEWQNTDAAHSSGAEAISTQVSTAGCLPECEEPRSGCVNIESVMSSEQVSHAPSTSSIEDGTKVAGNEEFPQYQNKVEGKSNELNGIIRQSKLQRPDISTSKSSVPRCRYCSESETID
jgi:hypothetical protein